MKSYYPGAEVVIHYADGHQQTEMLVPPYSMGTMLYPISPLAHHVEFGSIGQLAVGNPTQTGLSVSDILVDKKLVLVVANKGHDDRYVALTDRGATFAGQLAAGRDSHG